MTFFYLKSLHIIFIVTWFAGLFYIIRLFIYHVEANGKEEPAKAILQNQYKLMSKRLWYIITWPSAIITLILAVWLLILNPAYLEMDWMLVKLAFVLLLYAYHMFCHVVFKQLQNDIIKNSSTSLRIWNEVSTVLLFAIVFLVVLKNAVDWIYGLVALLGISVILMLGVKLYKKIRAKRDWEDDFN